MIMCLKLNRQVRARIELTFSEQEIPEGNEISEFSLYGEGGPKGGHTLSGVDHQVVALRHMIVCHQSKDVVKV